MEQINVQVKFTIGNYTDALYYPIEEWGDITPEQLEADKQARYQTYLDMIAQAEATEES